MRCSMKVRSLFFEFLATSSYEPETDLGLIAPYDPQPINVAEITKIVSFIQQCPNDIRFMISIYSGRSYITNDYDDVVFNICINKNRNINIDDAYPEPRWFGIDYGYYKVSKEKLLKFLRVFYIRSLRYLADPNHARKRSDDIQYIKDKIKTFFESLEDQGFAYSRYSSNYDKDQYIKIVRDNYDKLKDLYVETVKIFSKYGINIKSSIKLFGYKYETSLPYDNAFDKIKELFRDWTENLKERW